MKPKQSKQKNNQLQAKNRGKQIKLGAEQNELTPQPRKPRREKNLASSLGAGFISNFEVIFCVS